MKQVFFVCGCLLLALSGTAHADRLGDFERDITTPTPGRAEPPPSSTSSGDDDCRWYLGECIPPPDQTPPPKVELFPREDAYLRLDLRYHNAGQDTVSYDLLAEKVKGKYGVSTRFYQYLEGSPATELDVAGIYFMYRPPASKKFQVEVGAGIGSLQGTQVSTGASFYLPMHVRFGEGMSLVITPTITYLTNPMLEVDGGLEIHSGKLIYTVGSKTLSGPTLRLQGGYLGLAYVW